MTFDCLFLRKFQLKLTEIVQRKVTQTRFWYQKLFFDLQIKIK